MNFKKFYIISAVLTGILTLLVIGTAVISALT